jgi:NTP pyrophosphatase (non-canonical NTP hydrolase)
MNETPKIDAILDEIREEIDNAVRKFPTWPTRLIDAGNVVSEEAGELAKACLQVTYEPHKETLLGVRDEAIQTAAMCVRLLLSLEQYDCAPGPQHEQGLQ